MRWLSIIALTALGYAIAHAIINAAEQIADEFDFSDADSRTVSLRNEGERGRRITGQGGGTELAGSPAGYEQVIAHDKRGYSA